MNNSEPFWRVCQGGLLGSCLYLFFQARVWGCEVCLVFWMGFLVWFLGFGVGFFFWLLGFSIFWPLTACDFIRHVSKIVSFVSSSCELPSYLPHCFREKEPEKGCLRFFFLPNWKWEKSWEFLSTAVLSQSISADWEPKMLCTQLQPCISCHCPRWNLPSPAEMIHFQNFS